MSTKSDISFPPPPEGGRMEVGGKIITAATGQAKPRIATEGEAADHDEVHSQSCALRLIQPHVHIVPGSR